MSHDGARGYSKVYAWSFLQIKGEFAGSNPAQKKSKGIGKGF